ncbi:MAG: CDP-alcohol phosphatidyltransferase family protein [Streptosporangiaceae bacterium]
MGSEGTARTMLTVPNALSAARLLGVPLFLWLVLGPEADGWALAVLAVSGFTDWLDGKLARLLRQASHFGQLLDPTADRLYIVAVLAGLTARQIIPLWLTALLVARELMVVVALLVLRRHGYRPALPVQFVGKAATLNLLYSFPLLLLGTGSGLVATIAEVIGWGFAIWGTGLYWWSGGLYAFQVGQIVHEARKGPPQGPPARSRRRGAMA